MPDPKWTTDDIPDLTGKTAVVTGANTGLGLETTAALAGHGAHVVLAVRNIGKGHAAMTVIAARHPKASMSVQQLDLSSLQSIRNAAGRILLSHDRIDLLVNNAGVMYTPQGTTADGFELQFGTNHLGHFALTGLLLDELLDTEGSRIVTVSSTGHKILSRIDVDDLNDETGYNRVRAYARSKLANLLFTYELQRRLFTAGSTTMALAAHPGGASTELARNSPAVVRVAEVVLRPMTQSAEMGALPTLRAATDPAAIGGQYYGPDGFGEFRGHPVVVASSRRSHDHRLQRRLWQASEDLTGVTYAI